MKKNILTQFLFILILSVQISAQLESIKEFPRAYESQAIFELTPVWISGNEILVCYKNSTKDTIFSRRTTNLGQSWSNQKIERVGEHPYSFYYKMELFKTSSGRLLFFYPENDSIYCNYSNDNGVNWIVSGQIPRNYYFGLSVTEIEPGKIILSYSTGPRWVTRFSSDNGETWSILDYYNIPRIGLFAFQIRNPQIVNLSAKGDSLLGIFSSTNGIIYSISSADSGNSWSDTTRIIDSYFADEWYNNFPSLKTIRDKLNNIWILYDAKYNLDYDDYSQADVSALRSTDNGVSWQHMENFTSYLGDDYLTGVTSDGENIFIFFNSSRNQPFNQGFYGILGQSEDVNTPPTFIWDKIVESDYEKWEVSYQVKVIDDVGVTRVVARLDDFNQNIQLFDDGMHNDSLASDDIFGNVLPYITSGNAGEDYAMDINEVVIPFDNKGVIADADIEYKSFPVILQMTDVFNNVSNKETTAGLPIRNGGGSGGKFDEGTFLFSGGFFLSGYSNGEMWSNAVASASLVEDYLPGEIGSDAKDPLNVIYVVNKRDPAFSITWQNWKNAVSLGAEFYDGDGDGIYNPIDKNWNGTWDLNEDMPPIIGDEIAWCVYNDALPKNMRRWNTVDPQGIEVRQTIFASSNPELENVVFIRYSILNTALVADVMDSVYFGIWEDADLGDHTNDVVGCDTLLNSAFYYDNEYDDVYEDNSPAFFSTFLQCPIVSTNNPSDTARNNFGQQIGAVEFPNSRNLNMTSHIFFAGGDPVLNDPSTASEARNYILGKDRVGNYPNPCTFVYGQVKGGVNCNEVDPRFWFSGDPVTNIGWIDTDNRDRRNLAGIGPFNLEKDKPQEIIIAYVIGRGTDPINSITVAREIVQRSIEEYQSNFATMTYTAPPATNPIDNYVLYQNYPNPFNPATTIRYELPQDGQVTIDIFDILGQRVGTIINEYKKADRYEVTFSSTGLASGVYIYQLRVNDFITSKKMVLVR